jgi:superoxide reductase
MPAFADLFKSADWKSEKHVPVIETPEVVRRGEFFPVTVTIGKEVAHPNKTEHHIRWIAVYFQPRGSANPYEIGKASFTAHGASTDGPDTSGVYTHHQARLTFKTDKPGTIFASSYCNIHGLWENSTELTVE